MGTITQTSVVAFCVMMSPLLKLNECKLLEAYKFPVHTTESCPKNELEWLERSLALNCNKTNGYMCIPNEDITTLLEFCYYKPKVIIPKGCCLNLNKNSSAVNDFKCQNFSFGCPDFPYFSNEIYKIQSCVSIGKRCFLAQPYCHRTVSTETITEKTRNNTGENIKPYTSNTVDCILSGLCIFGWLLAIVSMIEDKLKCIARKNPISANATYVRIAVIVRDWFRYAVYRDGGRKQRKGRNRQKEKDIENQQKTTLEI